MPLTLDDIAPRLAQRARAYIAEQRLRAAVPSTAEILREERRATRGFSNIRNLTGVATAALSTAGSYAMGAPASLPLLIGGMLGGGIAVSFHLAYLPRMRAHYTTRLFHESLQAVAQTRAEKAYLEILTDIAKLPQGERRKLLAPLNTLLDTHIQLAQWERELLTIQISPETLRQEAINLVQKAKNATDPTTRDAFLQSARLAEERLGVLPQIETMSQRLQAQQELIYQTLLSQQMALRRGKVAVQSVQLAETNRETTSLSDTATRLHQQSQSIEDAVQELLTVR
jgi:hypothetical protein